MKKFCVESSIKLLEPQQMDPGLERERRSDYKNCLWLLKKLSEHDPNSLTFQQEKPKKKTCLSRQVVWGNMRFRWYVQHRYSRQS